MKVVFSIVSYNYLPLAYTLGDSIKASGSDVKFVIFVNDYVNKTFIEKSKYDVFTLEDLAIPHIVDMAYKYDITEFCTAIKPFCIEYLFKNGYDKVIYFDPDILVFQNLDVIFNQLSAKDMVLTPHFFTPELKFTGVRPEGLILFSGVFNLGFLAIKKSALSEKFLAWWSERLADQCYVDKFDGLHVDQKWVDYAPAFLAEAFGSINHLGMNMAMWNLHERLLYKQGETYMVQNKINPDVKQDLVFFHFSSFDYYGDGMENKLFPLYKSRFSEIVELVNAYRLMLINNGLFEYRVNYAFGHYENGEPITAFHRRFYRIITEREGKVFTNPFSTKDGTFYEVLKNNKFLLGKAKGIEKLNETSYSGFDSKIKLINKFFIVVKTILGAQKYALLTKFFIRYFRPENQVFLLKEYRDKYKFINENRPESNND